MRNKVKELQSKLEELQADHKRLKEDFDLLSFTINHPSGYAVRYELDPYIPWSHMKTSYVDYLYQHGHGIYSEIKTARLGWVLRTLVHDVEYEIIMDNKYFFRIKLIPNDKQELDDVRYFEVEKKTSNVREMKSEDEYL